MGATSQSTDISETYTVSISLKAELTKALYAA